MIFFKHPTHTVLSHLIVWSKKRWKVWGNSCSYCFDTLHYTNLIQVYKHCHFWNRRTVPIRPVQLQITDSLHGTLCIHRPRYIFFLNTLLEIICLEGNQYLKVYCQKSISILHIIMWAYQFHNFLSNSLGTLRNWLKSYKKYLVCSSYKDFLTRLAQSFKDKEGVITYTGGWMDTFMHNRQPCSSEIF